MTKDNTITKNKSAEISKEYSNQNIEIAPEMDIYTDADHIYLEGNVPGVDESSLDISFEKNTLTILGKNQSPKFDDPALNSAKFRSADYRRSLQFTENIDIDGIEATVKNGVFKLKIPVKKPEIKKISIKTS